MVVGQQICRDHDGGQLETKPCDRIHTRAQADQTGQTERQADGRTD